MLIDQSDLSTFIVCFLIANLSHLKNSLHICYLNNDAIVKWFFGTSNIGSCSFQNPKIKALSKSDHVDNWYTPLFQFYADLESIKKSNLLNLKIFFKLKLASNAFKGFKIFQNASNSFKMRFQAFKIRRFSNLSKF